MTIDGRTVEAKPGATVLQTALDAGIYIPHLCHDEQLEPYGGCRMCIVDIDGSRGLPAACTTQVAEGMVVRTDTEPVNRVRRMVCEMMIADHPDECLSCTVNQTCGLQKVAAYLGVRSQRLATTGRQAVTDASNEFFHRDLRKCILCGLCSRVCHELLGVGAIDIAGRGFASRVTPFGDTGIGESTCESCGQCVDICPVGALTGKNEALPPVRTVNTICPYCGCGCGMELGIRNNRIVRVRGDRGNPASRGSLCVKGRFGLDFVSASDRLTTPLIRRNGRLEAATWNEALDLVAARLIAIRTAHGAAAIAGFSSAKCTNEENYLFQKTMRAAIGTNHVDHCARLCHASTVAGLARAFGSGAMTNSIAELEHSDCIFVIGSNTTEAHPIVALRIKAAARHGAQVIVADPRRIDLVRFAAVHLRQQSGTDVALLNAMMHVILQEGLADEEFIRARTEGFAAWRPTVIDFTPEQGEAITGVPADRIRQAARIYARSRQATIVYSMGITQHTTGTDNVLALANLAMLTGNLGKEFTGVDPLRGQNNVQGACDMGALPNVLPGYQAVDDAAVRDKFENAWSAALPDQPGLTVVEIMHAAVAAEIRALYVMGENPMVSDPNLNHVRKALAATEFLVVQDIFLTETARMADVVLPAAAFAEKDGTFTNTERRVQRVRRALDPPGQARPDWQILGDIARRLGYPMQYRHPAAIMAEIAAVTPIYGGVSYDRLQPHGLQWPCPDADHPGTPYLHQDTFKRGRGLFHVTPFRAAAELPDAEYPYLLTTGRVLYQYHTGSLSRRTQGLERIAPPGTFEIHPRDAEREGLAGGDPVRLYTRRGSIEARAIVTSRSPEGTLFMSFHYGEAAANTLTNDALDPVAKIPELKVCAARLEKRPDTTGGR